MDKIKNKALKLILSGLENIPNSQTQEDCVIFGDWMSEIMKENVRHNFQLFPFDFNLNEIQSKQDILNQDKRVRDLYSDLLPSLATSLNVLHEETLSEKQWEVIIGYWLRHFLDALMVRWVLVSKALQLDLSHVYMFDTSDPNLCPQPSTRDDFANLCNSSFADSLKWNQFIISMIASKILNTKGKNSAPTVVLIKPENFKQRRNVNKQKFLFRFKNVMKRITKFSLELVCSIFPSKILIYSPNLTVFEMLVLSVKLRKFPYFYFLRESSALTQINYGASSLLTHVFKKTVVHNQEKDNLKLRDNFSGLIKRKDAFSTLIMEILPYSIPRCYIEEWSSLNEALDKMKLPKNINQIYVGSGIITDELLRLYVAKMSVKDCEFIISQHGGVYGFSLIQEKTEFIEQRISDKWISWGWTSNKIKSVVPGPALKGALKLKLNSERKSLFLALPPVRFSPGRLNYSDPYEIVQTHIDFIQSLEMDISQNVIIRPAPNHRNFRYIKDFERYFKVSKSGSFKDDLSKSKLFLCTHNATTMLEALYSNFPTIILLPKYKYYTQHYVRDEALPIIQEMKNVGIYFDNPEAAREKIHSIWSDVDGWWQSKEIQEVVNKFCQVYCAKSSDYLTSLAVALKS